MHHTECFHSRTCQESAYKLLTLSLGLFEQCKPVSLSLLSILLILMLAFVQQNTSVDDALPVYAYASPILVRSLVRVRVRASLFPLAEVAFLSF